MASGSPCRARPCRQAASQGLRTDAPQHGRKNIVLQVDLVGRVELAAGHGRQEFWDSRVGRAGRLAGDDELRSTPPRASAGPPPARRRGPLPARSGPPAPRRRGLGGGGPAASRPCRIAAPASAGSHSHFRAMAAVGHASTHWRAARCSAADMASSKGTVTRTSNPRPTKASPTGSPACSATRRQLPQRIHLPGS